MKYYIFSLAALRNYDKGVLYAHSVHIGTYIFPYNHIV